MMYAWVLFSVKYQMQWTSYKLIEIKIYVFKYVFTIGETKVVHCDKVIF